MFARLLSSPAHPFAPSSRGRTLAAAFVASLTLALLLVATPAHAVVAEVGGVDVGLQPRDLAGTRDGRGVVGAFRDAGPGPIVPANHTYAIFWDPTNSYHGNWQESVETFFRGMGAGSGSLGDVFAVDSQYTDPANQHALYQSTFNGAYTDVNEYPPTGTCTDPAGLHGGLAITCLTGTQMREQLETFITQHDLPKGMETIYYLLTPPGVTVCLAADHCSDYPATPQEIEADELHGLEPEADKIYKNSFCSYHSDINPDNAVDGDSNTVLYAVVPWIAGGEGDFHLAGQDQDVAGYDCQDGAFYFNSKTSREEKETPKVTTQDEEEKRLAAEKKEDEELKAYKEAFEEEVITEAEFLEKRSEVKARRTKREAEETGEREQREKTEGPHQQEPNQDGRGEDGSYDGGLADLIVSQIGVEQQNIVTDPLLNGWQDGAGNESTDECRNFFAPYENGSLNAEEFTEAGSLFNQSLGGVNSYINDAFNLAAYKNDYPGVACLSGVNLTSSFTAPNPVKAGEIVGFDGMGSDITLDGGVRFVDGKEESNYPVFTWNFGDGSPEVTGYAPGAPSQNSPAVSPCEAPWLAPCAASAFHSYQYGGTYQVTLTVTDVGGDTTSTTQAVTVVGPPRPGAPGTPPASGTQTGSSKTGTSQALVQPLVAALIVPQSLRKALRKGLVVSYSVNEQVAGHFDVLLSAALAHHLRISGTPAVGLPAGSPAELVIAKAILVTTKGGRSAVHIQFSKRTAARLAHVHKLALMVRLTVRNATAVNPLTTSSISSATLSA